MTVPVEMTEECTESLAYPAALQTVIANLTFKLQKLNSYVYHNSPFITPSHTLFYRTTTLSGTKNILVYSLHSLSLSLTGWIFPVKFAMLVLALHFHVMLLLVFVLDGVTEFGIKGFNFRSLLRHAIFCCNT